MKVADFFCGAGGFSEGFRQAGFDIIFAVDKWEPAVLTHKGNHPECKTINMDIITLANLPDEEFNSVIPDTEVIIGSPPCVAFSSSNKSGKGNKEEGIKLIEAYLKIVARKKFKENSILKYWLLENVPNVQKYIRKSYTAKELGINDMNFTLEVCNENSGVYKALNYGAPTKRKRFICGDFIKPQLVKKDNNELNLRYILNSLGDPLRENNEIVRDPNWNFNMIKGDITDMSYIFEVSEFEWKKAKRLKEDKGYMGKMSFPENLDKPARTIMATMSCSSRESFVLGYGMDKYRLPTVREVATIMSFPIDYKFYGRSKGIKYKLVGNAVPPLFSFALGKAIMNKENESIPNKYVKVISDNTMEFINLNGKNFELNIEKSKKITSKFKYHIPYMIISSYRVELTNSSSDMINRKFKWTTEIHKSQGVNAKIYSIDINKIKLEEYEYKIISVFADKMINNIKSHSILQKNYCLTESERLDNGLIGPYELLENVKTFIYNEDKFDNTDGYQLGNDIIPYKIVIGYYILNKVLINLER